MTLPDERQRTIYFARFYPADLMCRFVAGLGLRRCMTESAPLPPATDPIHKHLSALESESAFRRAQTLRKYVVTSKGLLNLHIHAVRVATKSVPHSRSFVLFEEREFVIDMDLRDHEGIFKQSRSLLCSCDLKHVCSDCWLIAIMGAAACQRLLSDAVGLGPMLTVYSGGKGCHLWWGSPRARRLSEDLRLAIVQNYLKVPPYRINESPAPRSASFLSDNLEAAVDAMGDAWFRQGIVKRHLLAAPQTSRLGAFLRSLLTVPFEWPLQTTAGMSPVRASQEHWKAFAAVAGPTLCKQIYCHFGWPVIDADVTAGTTMHMLKTPFSIHSTTGRVALPLRSPSACDPAIMPGTSSTNIEQQTMLWREALAVFEKWLDDCLYPVSGSN